MACQLFRIDFISLSQILSVQSDLSHRIRYHPACRHRRNGPLSFRRRLFNPPTYRQRLPGQSSFRFRLPGYQFSYVQNIRLPNSTVLSLGLPIRLGFSSRPLTQTPVAVSLFGQTIGPLSSSMWTPRPDSLFVKIPEPFNSSIRTRRPLSSFYKNSRTTHNI